jgi:hypothetical protein
VARLRGLGEKNAIVNAVEEPSSPGFSSPGFLSSPGEPSPPANGLPTPTPFGVTEAPPDATDADDVAVAPPANGLPGIFLDEILWNPPKATEADDMVPAFGVFFDIPFADDGESNGPGLLTAPALSLSDLLGGPSFEPTLECEGDFKAESFGVFLRGANPAGTDKSGSDGNP